MIDSLAFRRAADHDHVFVMDTFLRSYITSHAAGLIQAQDWRSVMWQQFERVLARPGGETWVAYHPGETDHATDLYGWIAVERGHDVPLVIYVYVREYCRRWGIARRLFHAAGIDPTQLFAYAAKTGVVSRLKHKIHPDAFFDPLRARFSKENHAPAQREVAAEQPRTAQGAPRAQADPGQGDPLRPAP